MASLLSDIRTKYNLLSKTQKTIADYILDNPDATILLSITEARPITAAPARQPLCGFLKSWIMIPIRFFGLISQRTD